VCCSVLQCVAVCCSVLQCVAVCCSVLQCVAVYYFISYVYNSMIRPTQSILFIPLLVRVFHKSILRIVQYGYLTCCSKDFTLQDLILRTRLCGTGFIPQHCWVVDFHLTKIVRRKCVVPRLYPLRKGKSVEMALEFFYMIHRVGRITCIFSHATYLNLFYRALLQKRLIISRSLLIVATPYVLYSMRSHVYSHTLYT